MVFRGGDFARLADVTGSAVNFRGGTQVALGDMTGDRRAELVVTGLYPSGSRVRGYDGATLTPGRTPEAVFNTFNLGGRYANGLFLAVGDVTGDTVADLIFGSAQSAAPVVSVYSGEPLADTNTLARVARFTPAGANASTGVRVAVREVDGDGKSDLLTSSGQLVSAFKGGSLPPVGLPPRVFAFDPFTANSRPVFVG
jgi:hypothetical protein